MSVNEEIIREYIDKYIELYVAECEERPTCWFSYLSWISSFTVARNFNHDENNLVKELLAN